MMRRIIFCLLLVLIASQILAQTLGLRSTKTKLYQIDTDTIRIIYADGQENKAQRVANLVHFMARSYPIEGNDKLRKISILLQNETDIPNGYVGLAPWVSEFYISPPVGNFGLGSLPWTDLLSIHEFRHVQQRSAARTGLSEFAYYLFGEEFFSGIVNVSWPNWYTEGDAVISETALSNQGRGRLPAFLNSYREKVLSDKEWSYQTARNGSFKQFIPSHYNLGFLMQNYGREKFGQDFWDRVALESASYKGLIYPFSKAVKSVSGESTVAFYKSALEYYRTLWEVDTSEYDRHADPLYEVGHGRYEDHSYPVFDESGDLYFVIQSFDHVPTLYRYDFEKKSKKAVTKLGYSDEPVINVASGKVCWAEYKLHSRWERQDYSTIVVYDMRKKSRKKLTRKESYFSPALSADASKIVALHDDDFQNYQMHILDVATGLILDRIPNPQNYYHSFPMWSIDQSVIISAVRDTMGQMALVEYALENGETRIITPWSYQPIGRPSMYGDWIYYTQSGATVDELYRINLDSGLLQKVSNSDHSRYQPVINSNNGDLIFTEFSNDGRRLKALDANAISPRDISSGTVAQKHLTIESSEGNILDQIPNTRFSSKKYSAFAHPVNIHSWRPVFDDPIYGFELRSLNVLQSLRWTTGIQWNSNDNSYGPYTELTLGMWYPEILLGYTGWTRKATRQSDQRVFNWFEHTVRAGLRIPFKGFHGAYNYSGAVTSSINRLTTSGDVDFTLSFLSHTFNFVHRLRQVQKHPMTRFGQAVQVSYPHSITADTASQFQVKTDFTLPSFRNHVIWLQFDYRGELKDNTFAFGDDFQYSRGYGAYRSDWIYRVGINYQLPIAYPDLGFGGLVYFKRIRTNLFADISRVSMESGQGTMNSIGVELLFDIQLLNIEPYTFGLRWSHRLQVDLSNPGDPSRSKFGIFIPVRRI